MQDKEEYELIIKVIDELDYKKFSIKQLEEIEGILKTYGNKTNEVKLKKVKVKGNEGNRHNNKNQ